MTIVADKFNNDQFLKRAKDVMLLIMAIAGIISGLAGGMITLTKVYAAPIENSVLINKHQQKYEPLVDQNRNSIICLEARLNEIVNNQKRILAKLDGMK